MERFVVLFFSFSKITKLQVDGFVIFSLFTRCSAENTKHRHFVCDATHNDAVLLCVVDTCPLSVSVSLS